MASPPILPLAATSKGLETAPLVLRSCLCYPGSMNPHEAVGTRELSQLLIDHAKKEIADSHEVNDVDHLDHELAHLAGLILMVYAPELLSAKEALQPESDAVFSAIYHWYHNRVLPGYLKRAKLDKDHKERARWAQAFADQWRHWRWVEWRQSIEERDQEEAKTKRRKAQ